MTSRGRPLPRPDGAPRTSYTSTPGSARDVDLALTVQHLADAVLPEVVEVDQVEPVTASCCPLPLVAGCDHDDAPGVDREPRETWARCTSALLGRCNGGRMRPWWGTDGHNGRQRFYTCDRCGRTP